MRGTAMMTFGRAVLMTALMAAGSGVAFAQTGRLVELTGNDLMKYNVTAISAKPGELLHVKLKNAGTLPKAAMAHNFILLARALIRRPSRMPRRPRRRRATSRR